MHDRRLPRIASAGLVIGALLGLAGTFAPSDSLRGLAWGLDGIALVVAASLLTIHHVRRGNDLMAGGFLVFAVGQGLVVSSAAMDLVASTPSFGAGTGLWAGSLAIVSSSRIMPLWVRGAGWIAAILFAAVALQIFSGSDLTPVSEPLPFFAYPFLVVTMLGWAWVHHRSPD
jgi:hypothetical protein